MLNGLPFKLVDKNRHMFFVTALIGKSTRSGAGCRPMSFISSDLRIYDLLISGGSLGCVGSKTKIKKAVLAGYCPVF